MTGWTATRLPIAVSPVGGEAIDSWIEAYARRLLTCSRGLLDHLGLPGAQPRQMICGLTAAERQVLSVATAVPAAQLDRMTLARYDGIAVTIDQARRVQDHSPAWRRHTGSRYCPACLHDDGGRWQLTWRLPWAFACTRHRRLLADVCAGCGRRTHPDRPGHRGQPSPPGACTTPAHGHRVGARAPACGHHLSTVATAHLPPGGLVLHAAEQIHRRIDTAADGDPHARDSLHDLFVLSYKALAALRDNPAPAPQAVTRVLAECGGGLPPRFIPLGPVRAHAVAVAATLATNAYADDEAGTTLLAWIVEHDRRIAHPEPSQLQRRWKRCGPQLTGRILALSDGHLRRYHRLALRTATTHPQPTPADSSRVHRRAAALPALLWPGWSMRLVPADSAGYNRLDAVRAALAVMTLIPGSHLTYRQAVDLLGGYTTVGSARAVLTALPADQATATIRWLDHLAELLDTTDTPIDYTRRRNLFTTDVTVVDRTAYMRLAASHGWSSPSPLQLHILDRHLVTALTGAAGHTRVGPVHHGIGNAFNPLLAALPAALRPFVADQARQRLRGHGIDEPVSWQPPDLCGPPADWPGVDPCTVDSAAFAASFTRHATVRRPLARIAADTGLGPVHIRLYTELADLTMPDDQWDALATPRDGDHDDLLHPDRLHHLYHQQQTTLDDIAYQSLTTTAVVRHRLQSTGTRLASHRPRTKLVPAEWFQDNYIAAGKSLRQAAAEAGVSRNTLSKYARQHAIPTGPANPPLNPFAAWPADRQPPSQVVAACCGAHGIEYLRQVLAMPGHHTQRAAAAALGLNENVLMRHRQHIERAAGITIFHPGNPTTPTDAGAVFLHDAAHALQQLDDPSPGATG